MIPQNTTKNQSSTNRLNLADPRIRRAFDALLEPLSVDDPPPNTDATPLPIDIAQRIATIPQRLPNATSNDKMAVSK